MQKIEFGSTGLVIEKNGFGCLPIQRISETEAVKLLHKACDGGINFFDTARADSDSEQKVGAAFSGMRDRIVLATKTGAQTAEGFWRDLETSLRTLKTDYIDIYQFHNPAFCPKPGGEDGLYDAALEAKKQGKIRHISITNHRLAVARGRGCPRPASPRKTPPRGHRQSPSCAAPCRCPRPRRRAYRPPRPRPRRRCR